MDSGGFIVKRYSKIDENCGSKMKPVLLRFYYYWGVMNCTDLLRSALFAQSGLNHVPSENGAETAKTGRKPAIREGDFLVKILFVCHSRVFPSG